MIVTKQERRALRGWIAAAAVAFAAALAIVLYCVFSGEFDFQPLVCPTPTASGITYEETVQEV